jgi:hypothetical protein
MTRMRLPMAAEDFGATTTFIGLTRVKRRATDYSARG